MSGIIIGIDDSTVSRGIVPLSFRDVEEECVFHTMSGVYSYMRVVFV